MPALSYKTQFVPLVADGSKPHSIRARRRRLFKPGDTLMHYTAMRTKQCRKIRPDTICLGAPTILISSTLQRVDIGAGSLYYRAGLVESGTLELLAKRDGFSGVDAFFEFFRQPDLTPFSGQLIEWDPTLQFEPHHFLTALVGEFQAGGRQSSRAPGPVSQDVGCKLALAGPSNPATFSPASR